MNYMKKIALGALGICCVVSLIAGFSAKHKEQKNDQTVKSDEGSERVLAAELSEEALSNAYTLERTIQGTTSSFASPGFWLQADGTATTVLMTPEEIEEYNASLRSVKECGLIDLKETGNTIEASEVRTLIESYHFGGREYLDGEALTEEKRRTLEEKRNLDALNGAGEIEVRYALTTNAVNVRSYPTVMMLMKSPTAWDFDYFQESALNIGEGVLVYHQTADQEWSFIQAANYAGWVRTEQLAFCTRKEMEEYLGKKDFAVVLRPQNLTIDGQNALHFAMGSKLPLKWKGEEPLFEIPVAGSESLQTEWVSLQGLEWNEGYLPYTTACVLDQAMKLLNISYGWGQRENLLDCSATVLSVYSCFGFTLPRNTSAMEHIPLNAKDVAEAGAEEKTEYLSGALPGSLLVMKGHVMIYLGIQDGTVYALHDFTGYYDETGQRHNIMQCSITPLTIRLRSGASYLDGVCKVVQIMSENGLKPEGKAQ